jgi:aspartate 4-decarboxylase
MSDREEQLQYQELGPFEVKNKLIAMAGDNSERMMLNAGRGNPNWVALEPRHAFIEMNAFAMQESERHIFHPNIGGTPQEEGIVDRFNAYLEKRGNAPGINMLKKSLVYIEQEAELEPANFITEMADAILGDHYPVPDRMLLCSERIVGRYLYQEMAGKVRNPGKFNIFATEGGTAAMTYIFQTLMENKLMKKGDKVALGVPIFTPYLEIPELNNFEFVEMGVAQTAESGWKYSPEEIEKLADPSIKAFFLVNPSNPTSVAMHPETLALIRELIETRRKDLIILTDDVYGTFVNGFESLAAVAPRNTILVYSFSKYFGATGWRLGTIAIAEDNVLDEKLQNLSESEKAEIHERYKPVFLKPNESKLIDRMVADSRTVALNHTAGLSTPQQVQMVMFSLFCLLDKEGVYKQHCQEICRSRYSSLFKALGYEPPVNPYNAFYYTTINVPAIAEERYGAEFREHLVNDFPPIDIVWRLAKEKSVVLMDGSGFAAPNMTVRVSLANLKEEAYPNIGHAISELLEEYYADWQKGQGAS